MNGQLELTFNHQGGPDVGELPVVVDVVDASLETAAKPRLVQLASGWRQDLAPGTYLVRVRFPSGEEIRRTCTVRDGGHIPISIDTRRLAGHESLERSAALRPVVRDESTPRLAGTSFAAAWLRRWGGEASREWRPIGFDGITVSRDDYAVHYRFASVLRPSVLQLGGPRIAWRFVSFPAAPAVDVTVSPRGENDLAVEVTTGSTEAEALLGYLRTGAVEGADVTAKSLLQQKRRDPIAAAIGGYYLLRIANLDRLSAWGPNLSRQFPWLADGAVINAWQHIHAGREHRGDPDRHFDAAHQQLVLAARRGVPIYTEGLRLLVDGLRLLREDAEAEDAELDAALTFIEPFAMAADWSAATVTYSGADPAKPHSQHRYGIPEDHEQLMPLQPQDRSAAVPLVTPPAEEEAANRAPAQALDPAAILTPDIDADSDKPAGTPEASAGSRPRPPLPVGNPAAVIRMRAFARDLARDLARDRDLADALAGDLSRDLAFHLTRVRGHAVDRTLARGRDLSRDVARDLARTISLVGDLDYALARDLNLARAVELDRTLYLARELDLDLGRTRDVALDLNRDLTDARVGELVRAPNHARDLARQLQSVHYWIEELVGRLHAGVVNASGVDLSGLDLTDMSVLEGVVWTEETTWPASMREEVQLRSREIRAGVYQVRGGSERDPAELS